MSLYRFAPNTADNSSGQLWIASILCLIYCTLVLIVRLHIKWRLYGMDDAAISLATILQLGENIPLFIALRNGLGTSEQQLDSSQIATIGKATFAGQLFFLLTLTASKLSIAALMLRLFTRDIIVTRRARILCHTTIAVTLLWAISSIVGTAVSCSPSDFVRDGTTSHCSRRLHQWKVTAALDILTELSLVLLPILFVWPIQMKRHIKVQVAVAFGFRIPLIAIAAVHLHYVSRYNNESNMSQAIVPALVLQQCEVLWSLLSATIPTLKAFMRAFNSGFGMEMDVYSPYGQRYGPQGSKMYILGSVHGSADRNTATTPDACINEHQARPSSVEIIQGVKIHSLDEEAFDSDGSDRRPMSSVNSDSSQDMIIKRETTWSVSYEESSRQDS
ncbi:hypothetical protein C7974DRAFT_206270 [Boeremia exigua]|uniref:uncharacterized protein n=1 Tax=Boeremia exigua TaxID=749465 RepID=UPI001E8E9BFD|nr:uncharacterized protein C7974DRAFT_206270 [Boeremia exigua]KAH6625721.1 hypothetical protein C7974DRAFT_206270 [Boeremia exigua]